MLHLGDEAVVELTGLRNPCRQLDDFAPGLMAAMVARAPDGRLLRKAGVIQIENTRTVIVSNIDALRDACEVSDD